MAQRTFALLQGDVVAELITERDDIKAEWTADFLALCVEVTGLSPAPQVGWVRGAKGKFSAPAPYVPSKGEQMQAALYAGVAVKSTDTPALDATYDAIGSRWLQMMGDAQYIATFGGFSGGLSELDWTAKSGEVVFAAPAQFTAVARAIADWITGWQRYAAGKADAPPASPVTVA